MIQFPNDPTNINLLHNIQNFNISELIKKIIQTAFFFKNYSHCIVYIILKHYSPRISEPFHAGILLTGMTCHPCFLELQVFFALDGMQNVSIPPCSGWLVSCEFALQVSLVSVLSLYSTLWTMEPFFFLRGTLYRVPCDTQPLRFWYRFMRKSCVVIFLQPPLWCNGVLLLTFRAIIQELFRNE